MSIEVASKRAQHQIEHSFQVVVAEKGYSYDATLVRQGLNGNVCL